MPFTVRGRLALVCAVVVLAAIGLYATLVQSIDATQRPRRYQHDDAASIMDVADEIGKKVVSAYERNADVTSGETKDRPPAAGRALRAIIDSASAYVWVLDRRGFTIYNSNEVRALPDSDRTILDTLVASIIPGARAVRGDSVQMFGDRDVRAFPFRGQPFLLYSVDVPFYANGVTRVVAARFATPLATDLATPFLIMVPIVLVIALASASLFARIAVKPAEERIEHLINEVAAVSDGRSLHRRLAADIDFGGPLGRLTETLNAMIGRLEQSFAGLRRFTADASHELKTPLTVLRADVERAMATQFNRTEQLVALEEALAETTRMADLVESLLTLARADEGRFDLHREPVDLQALTRDVSETAQLLGESTHVNVRMASSPSPAVVPGDRRRLRQLFLNLVTNAIKYTPAGGSVELSLEVIDGTASFSVRDTGIGIAAADLSHVFERFWRADRARTRLGERGGFGLGLAISQYIAQAHGGSLTVQSRLGRGSTFTVALPLQPPADSASP